MRRLRVGFVAVAVLAVTILALPSTAGAAPNTTSTVTISSLVGLLQAAAGQGWAAHPDQTAGGTERFVQGPLTPPSGTGSLEMTVASTTDRALIFTVPFPGAAPTAPPNIGAITPTPWAKLTGSFSTFTRNANPGPSLPVLKIVGYQDFNDEFPLRSTGFTTLNFEGAKQTTAPAANAWQTWKLGPTSLVWQSNQTEDPGFCPQATPCTLADFAAHYPNGAWGQIQVGLGTGLTPESSFVDDVQISNGTSTITYDFGPPTVPPPTPTPTSPGYWLAAADGGIFTAGAAAFHGSLGATKLNAPIVGMAATPTGNGYWMVGSDGGVFAFGAAGFHGSLGATHLNAPIVGMAATADGGGYWLVGADGGVFSFGDAGFHGSTGGSKLAKPVVGMAATADSQGYDLAASDGGVFTFGDAAFHGSLGATKLNKPVVGMAADTATGGYWLVASDGGVFTFAAPSLGSTGNVHLNAPIVGMAATADDLGYRLVGSDGGIFCFGTAPFLGSTGAIHLAKPIVGMDSSG